MNDEFKEVVYKIFLYETTLDYSYISEGFWDENRDCLVFCKDTLRWRWTLIDKIDANDEIWITLEKGDKILLGIDKIFQTLFKKIEREKFKIAFIFKLLICFEKYPISINVNALYNSEHYIDLDAEVYFYDVNLISNSTYFHKKVFLTRDDCVIPVVLNIYDKDEKSCLDIINLIFPLAQMENYNLVSLTNGKV